jgi:hypothetical protein
LLPNAKNPLVSNELRIGNNTYCVVATTIVVAMHQMRERPLVTRLEIARETSGLRVRTQSGGTAGA